MRRLLAWMVFSLSPGLTHAEDAGSLLNLRDAEIQALIHTVADATGRNFVVDPRVKGKVTVITTRPTDPEDFYNLFLAVLRVNGFAALEGNGVTKIVPEDSVKQHGVPVAGPGSGRGEAEVTLVLQLQHVQALELVPLLRPLLPQHAHLAAHPAGNTLIVADTARSVERLQKLISRIDRPVPRNMEVVRLEYANATEMIPLLQGVTAATVKDNSLQSLAADPRTNSVLIGGSEAFRLEMRSLISHLDTPLDFSDDTQVVYLHYAEADNLVPILQSLAGSGPETSGKDPARVEIQADPRVNALILQGDPERLLSLRHVINQLDIRRAQVLVEGIIAEVSDDQSRELGVQWRSTQSADGLFGGTEFAGTSSGSIDGFDAADLGGGLTLGFYRNGSIRGLLRLIRADKSTNVLSTPSLVTMDNEQAEIVVGENVPFITGQFTNDATSPDNPFQTIERRDVGVVLRVRPQVNEGNAIRLDIEQEVSGVETAREGSDLITSKRSIRTTVMADDGQIIVLGGLIDEDQQDIVNKVPLLGDLPMLGKLFRNRTQTYLKTNLLVFLRPSILRDSLTTAVLTSSKYNYIRGLQLQQARARAHSVGEPVLLPEESFRQPTPPGVGVPVRPGVPDLVIEPDPVDRGAAP